MILMMNDNVYGFGDRFYNFGNVWQASVESFQYSQGNFNFQLTFSKLFCILFHTNFQTIPKQQQ